MQTIDVSNPGDGGKGWSIVPHNFEDDEDDCFDDDDFEEDDFDDDEEGEVGDKKDEVVREKGDKDKKVEEGGVILITVAGEYTLTGNTECNRVVVGEGLACSITLDNCRIRTHNNRCPFTLGRLTDIALHLVGDNMFTFTGRWNAALRVEYNCRLTIDSVQALPNEKTKSRATGTAMKGDTHAHDGWLTLQASFEAFHGTFSQVVINGGRITLWGCGNAFYCWMYSPVAESSVAPAPGSPATQPALTINGGDVFIRKNLFCSNMISDSAARLAVVVNGGSLTVDGYIDCRNNMVINGGTVKVNGHNSGYYRGFRYSAISDCSDRGGSVTITGGSVTARGGNGVSTFGIGAKNSPVTISGGHVKATSIEGNPLTISGKETVIEADSVNATDFGGATVRVKSK